MTVQIGTTKNLWRTDGRMNSPLNSLVFYAPLWHPGLKDSPFTAWDVATPGTHACTVTGATWGYQGRTFGPVTLDDEILVATSPVFQFTSALTAEIWLKRTNDTVTTQTFLNNQTAGLNNGFAININQSDIGSLGFWVYNGAWVSCPAVITAGMCILNVWEHWVFTYNAGAMIVYKNGVSAYTRASAGNIVTHVSPVVSIGSANGSNFAGGQEGEVRLYNRVPAASEVEHNYMSTKWRYL